MPASNRQGRSHNNAGNRDGKNGQKQHSFKGSVAVIGTQMKNSFDQIHYGHPADQRIPL